MRWALALIFAVFVVPTFFLHQRVLERRQDFPADQDLLYAPGPSHLRLMSVGYREALADLLWIRALIFAGEHINDMDPRWVARYVDGITSLAPRFRHAYAWGGVIAVYGSSKAVDRTMVEQASDVYERGLQQFPESHELLYPFGMLLLHQLPNTPGFSATEIDRAKAQGAELIRRAAAFGADPLVRQYAATLLNERAGDPLAIQFLEAQLLEAEDEDYRRLLRIKLERLRGAAQTHSIEGLRRRFLDERDRLAPYVSDTLWAIIRPEASPLGSPAQ